MKANGYAVSKGRRMERALAVVLTVGILLGGAGARGASTVPFNDSFDYPNGTDLDGTNGWGTAGGGSAIVTNSRAQLSDVTLANAFSAAQNAVEITFDVQPQFSEDTPNGVIPGDATYAFYVKTNGLITAYNGSTASNLTHTPLSETNATQVRVRVDYPAQTWSLWVGGVQAAADFGFYGTAAAAFTEIAFVEGSTNAYSYIDTVSVAATTSSVPPVVSFLTNAVTQAESVSAVSIPVSLYPAQAETVTVSHAVLPASTATGGNDYTDYTPGTLTFDPGETRKSITLTVVEDEGGEPAETIILGLNGLVNADAGDHTNLTYTIEADPVGPTTLPFYEPFDLLALGDLAGQNGWEGTDAVVQTNVVYAGEKAAGLTGSDAEMAHDFGGTETEVWTDLRVRPVFGEPDSTPPAGSSFAFYVDTNGTVVAYDGATATQLVGTVVQSNQWVQFTVHSDYASTNWSLYLNGSPLAAGLGFYDTSATNYTEFGVTGAGDASAYVDDVRIQTESPLSPTPQASFAAADASFAESVADATVTVTLNRSPTNEVRVDHFLAGGSADSGDDFTGYTPGTLVFAQGQTSTSFSFAVVNDTDQEDDETIVFGLRNFVNADAGTVTNFTYTILRDPSDDPATVSFLVAAVTREENVTAGSIPVVLSPAQAVTVTVTHAVLPASTATAGVDYTDYTPGTLTFDPGETNKAIAFTVVEDGATEPDETIVFGLSDFVNADPGTHTNFTYTIVDDTNAWYRLPFSEPFEARVLGDLDGQRGWMALNAEVQSDTVFAGSKTAMLTTLTNSLSHTFIGDHGSVWTDMFVRPVFGQGGTPPSGSTFAFFVHTNGHIHAYDGRSRKDLTEFTPPAPVLTEGQWTRFTVHSDYTAKEWYLYVNGRGVATNLAFYTTGATGYSEFGLRYTGSTNATPTAAYLDNLNITLRRPAGIYEPGAGMVLIVR